MFDRRTLLVASAAALTMPRMARANTAGLDFTVSRNGRSIGHHRMSFRAEGTRTLVDIDIALDVKLAFVSLYRYRHHNREIWEGSELVGFESRTDDNGTPHHVSARRQEQGIRIDGSAGLVLAALDAVPTSYWRREFLDRPWIDSQAGRLLACTVSPAGTERVQAEGRLVEADRFAVRGDLAIDLWYAGEHWVKLGFDGPDGSRIEYALERAPGIDLASAA